VISSIVPRVSLWARPRALSAQFFFCSTRSRTLSQAGSSRADSEMEVDPPSPVVRRSSSRHQSESYTVLQENQIKFQDDREKQVFKLLKDKEFISTQLIDADLLQKTEIRTRSRKESLYSDHKESKSKVSRRRCYSAGASLHQLLRFRPSRTITCTPSALGGPHSIWYWHFCRCLMGARWPLGAW
jgi:hypothetical protein